MFVESDAEDGAAHARVTLRGKDAHKLAVATI